MRPGAVLALSDSDETGESTVMTMPGNRVVMIRRGLDEVLNWFLGDVQRPTVQAQLGPEAAGRDEAAPDDREDDREWVNRQIVARRGQRAFREHVTAAYGRRCAVRKCTVPDILEAAHVTRYLVPKSNRMTNGPLLRLTYIPSMTAASWLSIR